MKNFRWILGFSVLILAFSYGLSVGFSKRVTQAYAGMGFSNSALDFSDVKFTKLKLPSGVVALPLGRGVRINNKDAEVASFVTNRDLRGLLKEQVHIWENSGILTYGMVTGKRGVAVGLDSATGRRYSILAWKVPVAMRNTVTKGYAAQGVVSVMEETALGQDDAEVGGTIPGIPVRPGGKGGAVFGSQDPGGRTLTAAYTNPGSIADNISYYRNALTSEGWRELEGDSFNKGQFNGGHVTFERGRKRALLLFAPARGGKKLLGGKETVVTVIVQPIFHHRGTETQSGF